MGGQELIKELGLKHLSVKDVKAVEDAMNTMDEETMLAIVDKLVGRSKKPPRKRNPHNRRIEP
jgi:hypothetical protein